MLRLKAGAKFGGTQVSQTSRRSAPTHPFQMELFHPRPRSTMGRTSSPSGVTAA
ncbi:MAG TPA: hypothetical protein PLM24_08090 [Methanothrix sp.]|nr:hypothetical protein [Methanothrix sp.]HPJ84830.1 hypothetical protein [Methanothrix sp.]HPR67076.1 hypothetical protein [Methanothrix sp.]